MHFQENKNYHPLSEEDIMKKNVFKSKCKINKIGVTHDTLTGRGGMALFVKYLGSVDIYSILEGSFGGVRKNKKGLPVWNIFKQVFCWFYDGTSRHLNSFDQLKTDEGYASVIEQLDKHLNQNTYVTIQEIVFYVAKEFKVKYSISGMTDLLHR